MESRTVPSRLFVEVTTRCNLQCGMCVKQNGSGGISEGTMSPETFASLAPAFPHLDSLILNGIGEPLLHPDLESFISQARRLLPEHATIGFQTNGMLLTDERARSLVSAGLDRVCLSLDSVCDDSFRSIRQGGELSGVASAFASLMKARDAGNGRGISIGIEFVLMKNNLTDLPEAVRWAGRAGASFVIVTQLLPYHKDAVSQAAYDTNTVAAISIYERWKAKAAEECLDIRRYLDTLTKVGLSPEEDRIARIVGDMRAYAETQGITLHVDRLLRRDEEWLAKAERVLAEAREAAREAGLELTLPGMAPRNKRECEFVEGDAAFISWDGNVHPCYFLWHRYSCYIGGVEKRVRPWVLGSLRERDILAIWNDAGSRSFRERVRRYTFPFCYDCGFALCDYVAEDDFEQDCYIQQVPCGSCLWCTGLFHCLQ